MIRFLATCCVVCVATASVAEAQFVRFGPWGGVRVRAPFVAVDVSPYGATSVRAPFTAVGPGYYGYGPVFPPNVYYDPVLPVVPVPAFPVPPFPVPSYRVPVYPTPIYPELVQPTPLPGEYRVARPSISGTLPEQLRTSAERLARSLSMRRNDADVWLRYLDPQAIIETIDSGGSPETLRGLVANYDGVSGNAGLASIQSAIGFLETRQLLREYVNSPQQQPVREADSAPVPAPADEAGQPTPAPRVNPANEAAETEPENLPPAPQPPEPEVPPTPPEPTPV